MSGYHRTSSIDDHRVSTTLGPRPASPAYTASNPAASTRGKAVPCPLHSPVCVLPRLPCRASAGASMLKHALRTDGEAKVCRTACFKARPEEFGAASGKWPCRDTILPSHEKLG